MAAANVNSTQQSEFVSFGALHSDGDSTQQGSFDGTAVHKTDLFVNGSSTPAIHSGPKTDAASDPLAKSFELLEELGFIALRSDSSAGGSTSGAAATDRKDSIGGRAAVNSKPSKSWSLPKIDVMAMGRAVWSGIKATGHAIGAAFSSLSHAAQKLFGSADQLTRSDNLRGLSPEDLGELHEAGQKAVQAIEQAKHTRNVAGKETKAKHQVSSLASMLKQDQSAKPTRSTDRNTAKAKLGKMVQQFASTKNAVQNLIAAEQRKSPSEVTSQELQHRLLGLMREDSTVKGVVNKKDGLGNLTAMNFIEKGHYTARILKNSHLSAQKHPDDLGKQLLATTVETSMAAFHSDPNNMLNQINELKADWSAKKTSHA